MKIIYSPTSAAPPVDIKDLIRTTTRAFVNNSGFLHIVTDEDHVVAMGEELSGPISVSGLFAGYPRSAIARPIRPGETVTLTF